MKKGKLSKLLVAIATVAFASALAVPAMAWADDDTDAAGDTWDGTTDTTWYNDTDIEFELTTAEQLAGLAELVDGGNNFAGKTIKLDKNIDLYYLPDGAEEPESFDPIGDDSPFAGTFDGQGHTISNLYQSGWAFGYEWGSYGSIGLFGELESATVKNLTISGAECFVEGGDVGGICGSATGACVFENITIEDSAFATYNNGNGGIIGWSGAGNYTFKNITIAEDTVLAGLWGSFDSSIGGVVGQAEPGATYNFENVDIKCRLDVYNDCTASYDYYNYRMCGMIIGRLEETTTIDGVNYPDMTKYNITCDNVIVTYGDWANYHYCEPTPGLNGGRGMRVEAGYAYDGLPADYDHSQCTTNHMNLIPFGQIFGGAQLGVKGLKDYEGVTVCADYVEWVKAQLLAGNDVKLDRDIVVDGTYIDSIPAPTNGNGQYYNPGIFNVVGEEVVFDLNGHSITYVGHADAEYTATKYASYYPDGTVNSCSVAHGLFFVNNGGNLTIKDSVGTGTVAVNGMASGVYAASPNSVITVEGGKWINEGCDECGGTNLFLYASHGGELYIKGGTFEQTLDSEGNSYLIVEHGGEYKNSVIDYSKTKIEITGGAFVGMNPEEAVSCFQDASNKQTWSTTDVVAEGYVAYKVSGNTWIVSVPISYIPPAETLPETGCGPDAACNAFDDVDASAWYHEYFDWAYAQNVIRGYDDGSNNAGPEDETTRAQVMTMLYRMAGEPVTVEDPCFNDVKKGAWYYEEVAWAKSVGLVTGYLDGSGNFGPDDVMTREQMATVLYRFAQLEGCDVGAGEDTNILSYADALEIGEYAVPAMQWAVGAGIISGYDDGSNCLGPKDGAERGQFAAMLMRMDAEYGIL